VNAQTLLIAAVALFALTRASDAYAKGKPAAPAPPAPSPAPPQNQPQSPTDGVIQVGDRIWDAIQGWIPAPGS